MEGTGRSRGVCGGSVPAGCPSHTCTLSPPPPPPPPTHTHMLHARCANEHGSTSMPCCQPRLPPSCPVQAEPGSGDAEQWSEETMAEGRPLSQQRRLRSREGAAAAEGAAAEAQRGPYRLFDWEKKQPGKLLPFVSGRGVGQTACGLPAAGPLCCSLACPVLCRQSVAQNHRALLTWQPPCLPHPSALAERRCCPTSLASPSAGFTQVREVHRRYVGPFCCFKLRLLASSCGCMPLLPPTAPGRCCCCCCCGCGCWLPSTAATAAAPAAACRRRGASEWRICPLHLPTAPPHCTGFTCCRHRGVQGDRRLGACV